MTYFPTCSTIEESDCSANVLLNDVLNEATNGSCPKSCTIQEYGGGIDFEMPKTENEISNKYFLSLLVFCQ